MEGGPVRRKRHQSSRGASDPYASGGQNAPEARSAGSAQPSPGWMGIVKERVITPLAWLWGGANNAGQGNLALPGPSSPRLSSQPSGQPNEPPQTVGWSFPTSNEVIELRILAPCEPLLGFH